MKQFSTTIFYCTVIMTFLSETKGWDMMQSQTGIIPGDSIYPTPMMAPYNSMASNYNAMTPNYNSAPPNYNPVGTYNSVIPNYNSLGADGRYLFPSPDYFPNQMEQYDSGPFILQPLFWIFGCIVKLIMGLNRGFVGALLFLLTKCLGWAK